MNSRKQTSIHWDKLSVNSHSGTIQTDIAGHLLSEKGRAMLKCIGKIREKNQQNPAKEPKERNKKGDAGG